MSFESREYKSTRVCWKGEGGGGGGRAVMILCFVFCARTIESKSEVKNVRARVISEEGPIIIGS